MTKTDLLSRIYTNNAFIFDTALPCTVIDNVINELYPQADKGTEERAKIFGNIAQSVYAYGSRGKEGFIPLTNDCRHILQRFLERTGVNLIFTPTIEDFRGTV